MAVCWGILTLAQRMHRRVASPTEWKNNTRQIRVCQCAYPCSLKSGSFHNKKVRHLLSKRAIGKFFSSEMKISDPESEFLTPPQIRDAAEETKRNLIPTKSKKKYEGKYLTYKLWEEQNLVKKCQKTSFLLILVRYRKQRNSLRYGKFFPCWNLPMMSQKTWKLVFLQKLFLSWKKGFQSKKTEVFTAAEIKEFLEKAPDDRTSCWR